MFQINYGLFSFCKESKENNEKKITTFESTSKIIKNVLSWKKIKGEKQTNKNI